MVFDASGVKPDEVFGVLFDSGAHDVGLAFDDRLSPTDDSVVGFDTHEEPPRWHEKGFDTCDLHSASRIVSLIIVLFAPVAEMCLAFSAQPRRPPPLPVRGVKNRAL